MKGKIAVIGSGVSGLVSAYLLNKKYNVTLFEKNTYLGGHSNTVTIKKGCDEGLKIDTGFIVCNEKNYPLFLSLLKTLSVNTVASDMSFAFYSKANNFYYDL